MPFIGATSGPASKYFVRTGRRWGSGVTYTPPFSIVAANAQFSINAAQLTLNKPTGVQTGDFLVACIYSGGTSSVTDPGGWTAAATNLPASFTGEICFTKTAGASEPSTYIFTANTTTTATAGAIIAFRGATGLDGTPQLAGTGSGGSATATASTITSSGTGRVWVFFMGSNITTTSASLPAGFTLGDSSFPGQGSAIWTKSNVGSGATGTAASTLSATVRNGTVSALVH